MQPGDLVRITRASIGVPKNTIGLIVMAKPAGHPEGHPEAYPVYHVQLTTKTKLNGTVRRYLVQDLRKVK